MVGKKQGLPNKFYDFNQVLLDISLTRIILALIKIKKNQVISLSFVES
jgi:hypothetical protein